VPFRTVRRTRKFFWSVEAHVRLSFEIRLDILPLEPDSRVLQLERDDFVLYS
jgi:hypothetical protein